MISWIQTTFQKHFRTIFLVLLAIIIVSFVFTIGAAPGIGSAESRVLSRTFYGVNLGSPEETGRLFGDANLSVFLRAGYPALNETQLQDYGLQRHAALHLANQLNLPRPTREDLATFVRDLRAFAGPDGQFDPQAYSRFRDSLKGNPQFNEAALARVLADDYRYDQVQELLGGPGYVLDSDVQEQIGRLDTSWRINLATLDYTSFQPDLQPTEEELRTYFENNQFRYEIPPQVRVSYIAFPAARFADQVELTEADIRAHYDANPQRFPNPAQNGDQPVDAESSPDADFAAVRDQVEAALRQERARRLAASAASDLTVALYDARADRGNIEAILSQRGLSLQSAQPFARNNPPAFLGGNPQLAAEAFRLNEQRVISDALTTPDGAVILVYEENLPARPAEFAAVQDRVRQDYLENQRRQRFAALGRTLREQVASRVGAGEAFEAAVNAVAQEQGVQVEASTHGPFTRREPPEGVPPAALNTLEGLQAGQVSDMVMTGNEGVVVHVAEMSRPQVEPGAERFAEVRTQLAEFNASRTAGETLTEMVQSELARSETATR